MGIAMLLNVISCFLQMFPAQYVYFTAADLTKEGVLLIAWPSLCWPAEKKKVYIMRLKHKFHAWINLANCSFLSPIT